MLRTINEARATAPERLWAEIDLGAVRANVETLRRRLAAGCRFVAVVKADAYGHGAVAVAPTALAAGADELAVADAREGAILRAAGIAAPIAILGPSAPSDAARIVAHRLVPAVADLELASALAAAARGKVEIDIEVDTGMRRHGIAIGDLAEFVRALRLHPQLEVRGVFTHFAGLDVAALPSMRAQWVDFAAAASALRQRGRELRLHACNTAGTLLLPAAHADAVRIGGGIYGFDPGCGDIVLRPAMTLRTRIAALRRVTAGDRVGYGGTHVCERDTVLALLPCGYADGLSRAHWNGAEVLVRGRRARIVGHVSMNQMVVDATGIDAIAGDEVVLLGSQGADRARPEAIARGGVSAYEITSLLRADLPRRYVLPAASR